MLKELGEPSKKLSEQTGGNACITEVNRAALLSVTFTLTECAYLPYLKLINLFIKLVIVHLKNYYLKFIVYDYCSDYLILLFITYDYNDY